MSQEQVLTDEGSHYEVSLTAGQAFVAFVLLLLSLAASFAFGLLIGKGGDDRLTAHHEAAIVNEAVTSSTPRSAELSPTPAGRGTHTVPASEGSSSPVIQESSDPSPLETATSQPVANRVETHAARKGSVPTQVAAPVEFQEPAGTRPAAHAAATTTVPVKPAVAAANPAKSTGSGSTVPYYAQLMSTSDQKAAEVLAAKLIDNGFTGAYVERATGPKGPAFRVRVKFASEGSARAAIDGLKPFSKEVWVTKQP